MIQICRMPTQIAVLKPFWYRNNGLRGFTVQAAAELPFYVIYSSLHLSPDKGDLKLSRRDWHLTTSDLI